MSKLVTIFGGSGFVGRYIARRMAKEGWRVRVAVRNVNEAMFVRPYGVVGQVEPVFCNIRDDASVAAVTSGADVVVKVFRRSSRWYGWPDGGQVDELRGVTDSTGRDDGAPPLATLVLPHNRKVIMALLDGKKLLITGVLTDSSIAFHAGIARRWTPGDIPSPGA